MPELIGDIEMRRGDSYPFVLTVKDSLTKLPINITGYTFKLTVDPAKDPIDATNNIFVVIGVVDPDQVANIGKVSFVPSKVNTATAGKFFYDIEMFYGVYNRTIAKYKFTILQDIGK